MVEHLAYPPHVRLFRCQPREIGVYLPIPLSGRLDALVEIAKDAWAPVMRKEVMSALLLDAKAEDRWLRLVLSRYRKARVSDAFVSGWSEDFFLWPPDDRGPRPLRLWGDDGEAFPPEDSPPVHRDEALAAAADYRIGMPVPSPLAGRLDLLLRIAAEGGAATTRKDLLAALILDAPIHGAKLAAKLRKYWHATVADAVIAGQPTEPIFEWPHERTRPVRRAARYIDRGSPAEPPPVRPLGRRVPTP